MFQDIIICCEDDQLALPMTVDGLLAAARARWEELRVEPSTERVDLRFGPITEGPAFSFTVLRGFSSINVDGTPEQNVDAAVWLRSLMPADGPRIVAFDSGLTVEVILEPGVTAAELTAAGE